MKKASTHFLYARTHEWFDKENHLVGITDHAQSLLGDIVFIELPELHAEVKAGQEIGVLESVKAASDYYAPISGIITEINPAVQNDPSIINQDPYGKGWICKIAVSHPEEQQKLLDEAHYLELIAEEV